MGCVPQAPARTILNTMESIRNRALGAFLGLAVGDAVGTTLKLFRLATSTVTKPTVH